MFAAELNPLYLTLCGTTDAERNGTTTISLGRALLRGSKLFYHQLFYATVSDLVFVMRCRPPICVPMDEFTFTLLPYSSAAPPPDTKRNVSFFLLIILLHSTYLVSIFTI